MRARDSRHTGFTLIELMIVVAIIAIIAAIAIPSLQAARKAAIEGKAVSMGRTIVTAQEQYRTRFGTYAVNLSDLGDEGFVPQLVSGTTYFPEYQVVAYQGNVSVWALSIAPQSPGVTADRYFYVDASGVIRVSAVGPATSLSPPLD